MEKIILNTIFILANIMLIFSVFMLYRNYKVSEFREKVLDKDIRLWLALLPYEQMLYRFWDWKFHKMIKSNFYKYSGLTKSEILKELVQI